MYLSFKQEKPQYQRLVLINAYQYVEFVTSSSVTGQHSRSMGQLYITIYMSQSILSSLNFLCGCLLCLAEVWIILTGSQN